MILYLQAAVREKNVLKERSKKLRDNILNEEKRKNVHGEVLYMFKLPNPSVHANHLSGEVSHYFTNAFPSEYNFSHRFFYAGSRKK